MSRMLTALLPIFLITPTVGRAADLRYFDDAPLRAVQFIDKNVGWAVGDEGVVWHTIDGGQTWERLATGVRASLRSVQFLNGFIGWVAGREECADGSSLGVLLLTKDGGQTWQRILANALPGLNQVRFLDVKTGYVFGDGTDGFAAGIYKTIDSGRTWEPVKGPRAASWLAGAFLEAHNGDLPDAKTGVFAGAWTQLATLRDDQLRIVDNDELKDLGGRQVRGLHVFPRRIVAVGQGGLVLTSVSGGARYGFADLKLSQDILANLDFNSIHGVGDMGWVVGRPGSCVLHTADAGATWSLHKTGHSLPLHGVFFHDDKHGWTVGELGTILATSDGGKTWKAQRQGGKRAALLAIHARPGDLPLDTIADLGGQEGYLAAGLGVCNPDAGSASLARATDSLRVASALRQAGGAAGELLWQFSLPQHLQQADAKRLLAYWNQLHAGRADQELLRQLVLAVRLWRPDVVVGDAAVQNGCRALVAEALTEAVKRAADPKNFPEQLQVLGLSAWSVGKYYALADSKEATTSFDNQELKSRLEDSPRDFATRAQALLADSGAIIPPRRHYHLRASRQGGAEGQAHFMDGLTVAVGDARRKLPAEDKDTTALFDSLRTRRNLLALAEQWEDTNKAFSQIAPTLTRLPDDQAAVAAHALAGLYVRRGQWQLAREANLLLADRFPAHPLAVDAYRWLIRHNASSEARRRHEKGQFLMVTDIGYDPVPKPNPKQPLQQVHATEKLAYLTNLTETRQWYKGSLEVGKRLGGLGPLYVADPSIQMCLQSARRNLGEFKQAQEWYRKLTDFLPKGPWQEAASAELWLHNRTLTPPKRLALCRLAEQKPFLDGEFDDACWKGLPALTLTNAIGDTQADHKTEAWFAADAQYFYVALRCQHPPGRQAPLAKSRPRDADLDAFDRVSILLDLDRDYSTYFRLEVDQRGQVREDCWGDRTWNPKWYVAVTSGDGGWQVEAAIPLNELSADRVVAGAAWALNVVRILPGRGVQAWSMPADVEPRPEGMGLMLFEQDGATRRPNPPPLPMSKPRE